MAEPVIISATKQGGVENAYVVLQPPCRSCQHLECRR